MSPELGMAAAVAAVLLFCVVVILSLIIWSIRRHREPRLRVDSNAPFETLIRSLAGLTHGTVIEGNAVSVLENGAFFDVLLEDIAAAQRSVHFEAYLWKDGMLAERIVSALAERARAGLRVRVLVDASGGKKMGEAAKRGLVQAGCAVAFHHRRRVRNIGVLNERDHRKVVVLDGRTAYAGGHCVTDEWLGEAQDKNHFRDVSVVLRGPAVHALQSAFSENWVEETGELFVGDDVFPALAPEGEIAVHVARVKPEGSAPAVKILHHLAICCARRSILIQNPYFIPDPSALEAFARAVARGVDVRIMTPAAHASDMPLVQHAGHRNFDQLLGCGVRIFEYQKTLLHQKLMVIDGLWCCVGSSNFDGRSFEINDEITLGLRDAALARRLEEIFMRDLRHCVELQADSWQRRGLAHRLKDNAAYLLNEQL